jgi:hypothetical protein
VLVRWALDNMPLAQQVRVDSVKQIGELLDSCGTVETAPDDHGPKPTMIDSFWPGAPYHRALILVSTKAYHEFAEVDFA